MAGWHVERPEIFFNNETWTVGRHDKTSNPARIAILVTGARENEIMRRNVHASVPHLGASDVPAITATHAACFHPGRVGAMLRLRQTKRETQRTIENAGDQRSLLF